VPVLVLALGLVGLAVSSANHRGALSALELRMQSYVYTVLAAMEVDPSGAFEVASDFADPLLLQPGSGLYVQVSGSGGEWRSPSALGVDLPAPRPVSAGISEFLEPAAGGAYFIYRYGIGWQQEEGGITPFTVSVLVHGDEIRQQTGAFRKGLWQSLALAGVILVLAQVLTVFVVLRPLRRVEQDVARVESGRAERLPEGYPPELEPLARNVNRLLETEKSNQQRIRHALDSLAHSLKTPMAVLQAGLPLHGGKAERSMQNALDEMQHLVATRLERAGGSARRTLAAPVPVKHHLERIVESLHKVHSHKMIGCELKLEPDLQFFGEERDLLELAGNLLDNAFKYGSENVAVSGGVNGADRARPGIWLRVEDDGPGMPPERRDALLQRGVRGDERVEGHGLGLAIVQELVDAYGGEVTIENSAMGGAAVEVRLPPS